MTKDQILVHAAEQCRRLALRVRTDYARQELLRLAGEFEAKAENQPGTGQAWRQETAG